MNGILLSIESICIIFIEAAIKREKQEAEDIIKEDEYLEKVIEPEIQSNSPVGNDETEESVVTSDEFALEPADAKKASSYPSDQIGWRAMLEEARVNDIYFTSNTLFSHLFY